MCILWVFLKKFTLPSQKIFLKFCDIFSYKMLFIVLICCYEIFYNVKFDVNN